MLEFIKTHLILIVAIVVVLATGVVVLTVILKKGKKEKTVEEDVFSKAPVIYLDDDKPTEKGKAHNRKKADFAWVKDKSD